MGEAERAGAEPPGRVQCGARGALWCCLRPWPRRGLREYMAAGNVFGLPGKRDPPIGFSGASIVPPCRSLCCLRLATYPEIVLAGCYLLALRCAAAAVVVAAASGFEYGVWSL